MVATIQEYYRTFGSHPEARRTFYAVAQSYILVRKGGEWAEQPKKLISVEAENDVEARLLLESYRMRVELMFTAVEPISGDISVGK